MLKGVLAVQKTPLLAKDGLSGADTRRRECLSDSAHEHLMLEVVAWWFLLASPTSQQVTRLAG